MYNLFLLTILGFPILAIVLYKYIKIHINERTFIGYFLFFAIQNVLFFLGFSVKGELIDFGLFSIEYLALCLAVFTTPKALTIYAKIFNLLGIITISISTLFGLFVLTFPSQFLPDFKAEKVFHFESKNKKYEVRMFTDEFVTAEKTMYTFVTYRQFLCLPFEKKIDKVSFLDSAAGLRTVVDKHKQ